MIDDMKFLIDGRQLLDLIHSGPERNIIVRKIREQQMLFQSIKPTEEVARLLKKYLEKNSTEIAV